MQTVATERAERVRAPISTASQATCQSRRPPRSTQTTLRDFNINWGQFATEAAGSIRSRRCATAYITNNPNPTGQRQLLDVNAADKARTNYDFTHSKIHPTFRRQLRGARLCRPVLLDPKGNLIYSVKKHDDFATNFAEGGAWPIAAWAGPSGRRRRLTEPGQVSFEDSRPMRRRPACRRASWRRRCSTRAAS